MNVWVNGNNTGLFAIDPRLGWRHVGTNHFRCRLQHVIVMLKMALELFAWKCGEVFLSCTIIVLVWSILKVLKAQLSLKRWGWYTLFPFAPRKLLLVIELITPDHFHSSITMFDGIISSLSLRETQYSHVVASVVQIWRNNNSTPRFWRGWGQSNLLSHTQLTPHSPPCFLCCFYFSTKNDPLKSLVVLNDCTLI